MAAVLANRPAVASHTAAGRVWGLLRYDPERIHLTVPTRRRQKRPFILHFSVLPSADLAEEDGIPVTSLPRTQLDLAADFSRPRLERLLERAEELRLLDIQAVRGLLSRYPRHPGAGALRDVLSIYGEVRAVTRSDVEKLFLTLMRDAELPLPAMNYVVAGMELDAYWESERFAVELDVYETHGTRMAFERDRIRDDDLLALGIEMIRVTGPRLEREPEQVVRRLGEHLARRRNEPL